MKPSERARKKRNGKQGRKGAATWPSVTVFPESDVVRGKLNPDHFLEVDIKGEIERERKASEEFRKAYDALRETTLIARQIHALREKRGITQAELARIIGTRQQVISRLERPGYSGHSLAMLRRVVRALEGRLVIEISG